MTLDGISLSQVPFWQLGKPDYISLQQHSLDCNPRFENGCESIASQFSWEGFASLPCVGFASCVGPATRDAKLVQ